MGDPFLLFLDEVKRILKVDGGLLGIMTGDSLSRTGRGTLGMFGL